MYRSGWLDLLGSKKVKDIVLIEFCFDGNMDDKLKFPYNRENVDGNIYCSFLVS